MSNESDFVVNTSKKKKIMPQFDNFATKKRKKDCEIELKIEETNSSIQKAVESVRSLLVEDENKDPFLMAINDGLSRVRAELRTTCLIEMMQVIQKYQVRNMCQISHVSINTYQIIDLYSNYI